MHFSKFVRIFKKSYRSILSCLKYQLKCNHVKKVHSPFRDIKVWIAVGIVLLLSLVVGFIKQPFRFGFLNTLGITTAILFLVGTFRQAWMKGDFSSLEFQRSKDLDPTYADYRKRILIERSQRGNIPLYASIILLLLCIILPRIL